VYEAASAAEAPQALLESLGTHVVDDDVHARLSRPASRLRDEVGRPVIHGGFRAELPSPRALLVGARRGENARSRQRRDLDRRRGDARARGLDEHELSGAKPRASVEHVPCGEERQRHRGGGDRVKARGLRVDVDVGDDDELRAPAVRGLAQDLGFSSHSHFSAAFRQAYGMSPSDFAKDFDSRRT
jgi:AraC-like DNA-binding protein